MIAVIMFKVVGASLTAGVFFIAADQELYGARHTYALLALARSIVHSFGV
jgi:hypothetical protein